MFRGHNTFIVMLKRGFDLKIALLILIMIGSMAVGTAHVSATRQSVSGTPAEICENALPVAEPDTREYTAPEQVLEAGVDYRAVFCTGAGAIYIDLLEDYAPLTVNSFVFLALSDFYNNTTFHRVFPDFMAQGGDPTATGGGGPGYRFQDEVVGFLNFDRPGWLAMANAGLGPDGGGTNGSQFFITTGLASHLDGLHTIFGEVLEGQEIAVAIDLRDPDSASEPGTALDTVVIITDPASVSTSYQTPASASQDDIVEALAFENISLGFPPGSDELLSVDDSLSGVFTTDEIVASLPEEAQDAFAGGLTTHNHEYRVANTLVNVPCDPAAVPFLSVSYQLDAFATREDATAAIEAGVFVDAAADAGFVAFTAPNRLMPFDVYQAEAVMCDSAATRSVAFWQRGRFVATAEIVLPLTLSDQADLWLDQVVGFVIYERALSAVLRAEIR